MLHLPLRAANLILELPAGVLEGIVEGECQIGMALIRRRRPFHIHLASLASCISVKAQLTSPCRLRRQSKGALPLRANVRS